MTSRTVSAFGGLSVLLLLLLSVSAHGAAGQTPGLELDGDLAFVGSGKVAVNGEGALGYHGYELPERLELQADRVTLVYSWKEGQTVASPWQEDFQKTTTAQGRETSEFANITLEVEASPDPSEVLAYTVDGQLGMTASGTGEQSYQRLDAQFLTRVGSSPDTGATNDSQPVGFWYQPEADWMAGARSDKAAVDGDFSLFLNNMTVTIRQDGETVWENWTGYREENAGPAAASYERHLLKVHVTNGTLTLAEDDSVSVFGPVLEVQVNGTVTAETATGQLDLEDTAFAFDGEPLRMEGEGRFQVSESSSEATPGLGLWVADGSGFDVQGGQPIDPGLGASGGIAGWKLWAPISILGLAVAGGVAYRTGYAGQALESWRSRRYTKWMTRGRELANAADYDAAAPCFRRATRAQPVKGVAWYHLAIALLEDGRPREVLAVIDEAREGEAIIDELDFLDLEAQAARRAGEKDRCRAAVARLADGSEAMATTLVRDLGLSEEALGHELATRLSWEEDEEALPGYV